jgi:hypothetical protein
MVALSREVLGGSKDTRSLVTFIIPFTNFAQKRDLTSGQLRGLIGRLGEADNRIDFVCLCAIGLVLGVGFRCILDLAADAAFASHLSRELDGRISPQRDYRDRSRELAQSCAAKMPGCFSPQR